VENDLYKNKMTVYQAKESFYRPKREQRALGSVAAAGLQLQPLHLFSGLRAKRHTDSLVFAWEAGR